MGTDVGMAARYEAAGRKMLSRERELSLVVRAQAGDERAARQVIEAHLPLVQRMTRSWRARPDLLDDLMAEGRFALVIALQRFDPTRGFRFGTYARWWIEARIARFALRMRRSIAHPETREARRVFYRLPQAELALHRSGVEVTASALAEALGAELELVETLLAARERDASIDDRYDLEAKLPPPDAAAEQAKLRERLETAIATLGPREQVIARRRLMAGETLQEVADELGTSRQRVQQLERDVVVRLRELLGDLASWTHSQL